MKESRPQPTPQDIRHQENIRILTGRWRGDFRKEGRIRLPEQPKDIVLTEGVAQRLSAPQNASRRRVV